MFSSLSPEVLSLLATNIQGGQTTAENFTTLDDVPLPDGGTIASPKTSTATQLLGSSESYRFWYLLNIGPSIIHLFHTDTPASLQTPFKLLPGLAVWSGSHNYKLPVFGWSKGNTGLIQPSYYYE